MSFQKVGACNAFEYQFNNLSTTLPVRPFTNTSFTNILFKLMAASNIFVKNHNNIDWRAATTETYTSLNPITVWRIPVFSFIPNLNELKLMLSFQEIEKINRYQHKNDRNQRIISKAVLRILLGRYTGINPKEIRFQADQNKKLAVNNPFLKLNFNVSHSGDWVLIIIADVSVGIDVEQMDASFTWQNMLPLVFSRQEIDFIYHSTLPRQSFYELWTRKESLLKATGKGLTDDIALIPALNGIHPNPETISGSAENWQINSFYVDENHMASITFNPVKTALQFFNFQL
ncbi:MAG: 4'-phosphopantetheinyl transferase superfamily protein [Sphingobacteriaceae bacterium]|nr:MAG: 4'-phosphopantetheinyl transferase superfamily protein [Sphingobacteriaceae bacterium]